MRKRDYFGWLWNNKGYLVSLVGAIVVLAVVMFNFNEVVMASSEIVAVIIVAIPLAATMGLIINTINLWKK